MKSKEELQEIIKKEVFVTKDQQRIATKNGGETEWIFDFRNILLRPEHLDTLAEMFWERFKDHYPFQVAGLEVAGIPLIAAIVMKSVQKGKPVNGFFVRKSRKRDGLMKMVEGEATDDPIILVDDILNSGNSMMRLLSVTDALKKRVTDIFSILAFREPSYYTNFATRNISISSIYGLPDFGLPFKTGRKQASLDVFRVLWKFESSNPNLHYVVPKSAPALDETKVYFGSDNGTFWALNQSDGSVAWKYKVGWHARGKSIFSSPAVHGGTVFFGSYDGNLYALDAETGKRKWVFMEADWIGSSPTIAPDLGLLFVGMEFGLIKKRGGITAVNVRNGEKVWEYTMPEFTHSSPLYISERKEVVIGSNDGAVYLFNAKNGKLLWKRQTGGEVKESFAYDGKRQLILFGSFDGNMYALRAQDGSIAFSYETKAGIYSSPLIANNAVYIASLDKHLYKLDPDSGECTWMFTTAGRIFASPALIGDHVYIGSNDGRLYKIDAETGKIVGQLQVTERITNSIAYNPDTKHIFLPTFANELYCLEETEGLK